MFKEKLYVCDARGSFNAVVIKDDFSELVYLYTRSPLTEAQIDYLLITAAIPYFDGDEVPTHSA